MRVREAGNMGSGSMRLRAVLLVGLALFLATGCVSRRRALAPEERPLPALTASRAELLQSLEDMSDAVRTMVATVNLTASGGGTSTGVLTTYRETKGFLIVDRPSHLRMKGQAPLALATVFDMVSDGEVFRVSVPIQNKFIIGATDSRTRARNPVLNLRPQHVLEALFLDVSAHLRRPGIIAALEQAMEGRQPFYVFSFIDTRAAVPLLLEKIWIDRVDLEVARKQIFGEGGALETDVQYGTYHEVDGVKLPEQIRIERPLEDYSLQIAFVETRVNMELPENAFLLEQPAGAELIEVRESETGALE